jgi:hypothetical protein
MELEREEEEEEEEDNCEKCFTEKDFLEMEDRHEKVSGWAAKKAVEKN